MVGDGWTIKLEEALAADAPLRTTIKAEKKGQPVMLIEAQGTAMYPQHVRDLRTWIHAERAYCSLSLAVSESATVAGSTLSRLARDGVGLLVVHQDGEIAVAQRAIVPALVVTPDPGLRLGKYKAKVTAIVTDFNLGNRKAALRELCDLVELETLNLAKKAATKGLIGKTVPQLERMRWGNRIDVLSAKSLSVTGTPVITSKLADDLRSFSGARNLVDHPATSLADERRRERQFPERMLMGCRLISDVVATRRGF